MRGVENAAGLKSERPALQGRQFGVLEAPGGVVLEVAGGLDYGEVVAGAGYELEAYGEMLVGETAGDAEGGEAAEVADGAEWVGIVGAAFEVHVDGRGWGGLASGD